METIMKTSTRLALVLLLFAFALFSVATVKATKPAAGLDAVSFEVAAVNDIAPSLRRIDVDLQRLSGISCSVEAALANIDTRLPYVPVRVDESATARVGEAVTQSL